MQAHAYCIRTPNALPKLNHVCTYSSSFHFQLFISAHLSPLEPDQPYLTPHSSSSHSLLPGLLILVLPLGVVTVLRFPLPLPFSVVVAFFFFGRIIPNA